MGQEQQIFTCKYIFISIVNISQKQPRGVLQYQILLRRGKSTYHGKMEDGWNGKILHTYEVGHMCNRGLHECINNIQGRVLKLRDLFTCIWIRFKGARKRQGEKYYMPITLVIRGRSPNHQCWDDHGESGHYLWVQSYYLNTLTRPVFILGCRFEKYCWLLLVVLKLSQAPTYVGNPRQ